MNELNKVGQEYFEAIREIVNRDGSKQMDNFVTYFGILGKGGTFENAEILLLISYLQLKFIVASRERFNHENCKNNCSEEFARGALYQATAQAFAAFEMRKEKNVPEEMQN